MCRMNQGAFLWTLHGFYKNHLAQDKKWIMRLKTTFPGKDLVQVTEETKTSQWWKSKVTQFLEAQTTKSQRFCGTSYCLSLSPHLCEVLRKDLHVYHSNLLLIFKFLFHFNMFQLKFKCITSPFFFLPQTLPCRCFSNRWPFMFRKNPYILKTDQHSGFAWLNSSFSLGFKSAKSWGCESPREMVAMAVKASAWTISLGASQDGFFNLD